MKKSPQSILMVCSANCCRSVLAEALLKDGLAKNGIPDVKVFSRGTHALFGRPAFAGVADALKEWKIDVSAHRARPIERNDIQEADLILVAEEGHKNFILEQFIKSEPKTFLLKEFAGDPPDAIGSWNIPDPIGMSQDACRICRDDLKQTIDRLISKLWPKEGTPS